MKKILNDPNAYVDEMLDGLCLAHPELLRTGDGGRVVSRRGGAVKGKVGIATGGGSGHLPVFLGYVGEGLLDACAVGNVFAGPRMDDCSVAMKAADGGAGVLQLYGNYGGDRMNFEMAREMLELDGMEVASVRVADDVASAPADQREKRRGVAGIVFVYKAAGAKAAAGATLAEVAAVAQKANDACRSIGVALTPCIVPESGKPSFTIADSEVEFGMGIHGEPGIWRGPLKSADALTDEMLAHLLPELAFARGDRAAVLVNSLGATPAEELYIIYRRVAAVLAERGITPVAPLIGRYATSMEMAGASLTLMKLDAELEALLAAPAACPVLERALMLDATTLKALLPRWCAAMHAAAPELNELDGRLGDADLGATLDKCATLVEQALPTLPDTLDGTFKSCAQACAKASGSSFGTLLAVALMTATKASVGVAALDQPAVATLLGDIVKVLAARGGASLGDKTVLDALQAIHLALTSRPGTEGAAAQIARDATLAALDAYRGQPNRIGRARMFADRTIGMDDPGMVALLRMVESL